MDLHLPVDLPHLLTQGHNHQGQTLYRVPLLMGALHHMLLPHMEEVLQPHMSTQPSFLHTVHHLLVQLHLLLTMHHHLQLISMVGMVQVTTE